MSYTNSTFPFELSNVQHITTGLRYLYHVSPEVYFWAQILLDGYFLITISLIGVVGNILFIIVVYRQGMKDTPQILMMSLAASDAILSSITVVVHVPEVINILDFYLATTITTYIRVYIAEIYFFSTVLGFCTFPLISFERFIAVYFPFHVYRICTPFRIKFTLLFLYVYSFSATINCIFYFYPVWLPIPFSNNSYAVFVRTEYVENNIEVLLLAQQILLMYLLSIVPVVITTICCLLIIIKLVQNSRARLSMTKIQTNRTRNSQVVRMLLTVCLASCFTCIPTLVIDLFSQRMYAEEGFMSPYYYQLLQIFNHIFYQLSPTSNFFIYLLMSSKFSRTFKKIFKREPMNHF